MDLALSPGRPGCSSGVVLAPPKWRKEFPGLPGEGRSPDSCLMIPGPMVLASSPKGVVASLSPFGGPSLVSPSLQPAGRLLKPRAPVPALRAALAQT